jgi:hypothetical protein
MPTAPTLNLVAADGTPRTFTYAEIATHYANRQMLRRREWLESLTPELMQKYIGQSDSTTLEEDLLKCYDCDYHLMLKDRPECFDWAIGKMGFHLSEEDQADYDAWHDDKNRLRGVDWRGYRAFKAKQDADIAATRTQSQKRRGTR